MTVDDRAHRRLKMIPALSRLTRTREFRLDHPRELTIIPVLADDTIAYLMARLDEAESPAVFGVLTGDGLRLVSLRTEPDSA